MPQIPLSFPLFSGVPEPRRLPSHSERHVPNPFGEFGKMLASLGTELAEIETRKQQAEQETRASELFTRAAAEFEKSRQTLLEEIEATGDSAKALPQMTLEALQKIQTQFGAQAAELGQFGAQKFASLFSSFMRDRLLQVYREDTERFVAQKRSALETAAESFLNLAISASTPEKSEEWLTRMRTEYERAAAIGIVSPKEATEQIIKRTDQARLERAKLQLMIDPTADPSQLNVSAKELRGLLEFWVAQQQRRDTQEEKRRREEERERKELRANVRTQFLIQALQERGIPASFFDRSTIEFLGADEHSKLREEITALLKIPQTLQSDIGTLGQLNIELAKIRTTAAANQFISNLVELVRKGKLTETDMQSLAARAVSIAQEEQRRGQERLDAAKQKLQTEAEAYLKQSLTVSGPLATFVPENSVRAEAIRQFWEELRRSPNADPFAVAQTLLLSAVPTLALQFAPQLDQLRQLGFRSAADVLAALKDGKIDRSAADMYLNLLRLRDRLESGAVPAEPRRPASGAPLPSTSAAPNRQREKEREKVTGEVLAEEAERRRSGKLGEGGPAMMWRRFWEGPDAAIRKEVERKLNENRSNR